MATTNKSKALIIFGILAFLIILTIVLYFGFREGGWFKPSCDPNRNGFDKKGNPNPKCQVNDPKETNTPGQWVSDSTFPIKKYSWGSRVKALQVKLGVVDDGRFGTITENALRAKTGKTEIATQAEYDAIVTPKVSPSNTVGGDNFKQLVKNLGSNGQTFSDGVKSDISGKNKQYTFYFFAGNGRFFVTEIGQNPTQSNTKAKGTYLDGGKEMDVDGGSSYGNIISHPVLTNMKSIVSDIETN